VFPTLTSEDFRRPKEMPRIGDDRKDKIHLAVGRAVHQWEVVEHHLGSLFSAAKRGGDRTPTHGLRNDARGRDGGVRPELAAGIVRASMTAAEFSDDGGGDLAFLMETRCGRTSCGWSYSNCDKGSSKNQRGPQRIRAQPFPRK
jgi:hypothetical protein